MRWSDRFRSEHRGQCAMAFALAICAEARAASDTNRSIGGTDGNYGPHVALSRLTTEADAVDAEEEDEGVEFSSELDVTSQYIWHGVALSRRPLIAWQNNATWKQLALEATGSYAIARERNLARFSEMSLELNYEQKWQRLTLKPSLQAMLFPNNRSSDTIAAATDISLALGLGFSLTSGHYVDIYRHPGAYFGDAGIAFAADLGSRMSVEAFSTFGLGTAKFNQAYFGIAKTTLNDNETGLFITYSPFDWLYFRPHADLTSLLDHEIRRSVSHRSYFVVGAAVGIEL